MNDHASASGTGALNPNLAPKGKDVLAHDREAEPGALLASSEEGIEDALAQFFGDPRAFVSHLESWGSVE